MFKKVYIEITNVCNLNCKFCPVTKRKQEFMSVDNFEKIIKRVKDYTKLICLHVKGEPLLHPNLKEFLGIVKKYDLKVNITTNGTLIDKNVEILKNSGCVRQINFSLHSIKQNENFNTDYLNKIFKSVDDLKNIIISYRLWNNKNLNNVDENKDILEQIEKYYNLKNLQKKLEKNEFVKVKKDIFINQDLEFEWPDINKKPFINNGRCLALKDQIAILVDGTVVPCCLDNNGDIPLGNIFKESLEEIIDKAKSIEIKENFENRKVICDLCKTCGFLQKLEDKRK